MAIGGFMQTNNISGAYPIKEGKSTAPEQSREDKKKTASSSISDMTKAFDMKDQDIVYGSLSMQQSKTGVNFNTK